MLFLYLRDEFVDFTHEAIWSFNFQPIEIPKDSLVLQIFPDPPHIKVL